MYRMLKDYEKLGEATVVHRDGFRVTRCPTASAHGLGYRATAGGVDNSAKDWSDRKGGHAECAETRLAKAKLLVMLEALGGRFRESLSPLNRSRVTDEASRWFFDASDFEWWCEAAGRDPDDVRRRARQIADGVSGLNMEPRRNGWKREDINLLIDEKAKGASSAEIASKLGRSACTVNAMHYNLRKKQKSAKP